MTRQGWRVLAAERSDEAFKFVGSQPRNWNSSVLPCGYKNHSQRDQFRGILKVFNGNCVGTGRLSGAERESVFVVSYIGDGRYRLGDMVEVGQKLPKFQMIPALSGIYT